VKRQIRRRLFYAFVVGATATSYWAFRPVKKPLPASVPAPESTVPQVAQTPTKLPPAAAAQEPRAVPQSVEPIPKIRRYKVANGDTVEGIAQRYGLNPSTILWSNRITGDTVLQIGQELLIPVKDGILHEVGVGDSLWDVASAHQVEVDQVIKGNPDVSPDSLQPGQLLLVPGGLPARRVLVISRDGAGGRPAPSPAPAPQPAPQGSGFQWPLTGEITEQFGWRTHPVYGTRNFHDGIDIAVPEGTSVRATASGTVVLAEWYGGWGLTIKVNHGAGLVTRYSHNNTLLVKVGDSVKAGQIIARSGNTGVSTGPHLDFGIYRNDTPVDPIALLP
jgi:murein DD-endopeptidase MepM/ murein hydrolase activator NlpD